MSRVGTRYHLKVECPRCGTRFKTQAALRVHNMKMQADARRGLAGRAFWHSAAGAAAAREMDAREAARDA